MHEIDPAALDLPAGHEVHVVWPVEGWNVPGRQFTHDDAPGVLYVPAGQGLQNAELLAPTTAL